MKKPSKKLSLGTETVRALSDLELATVPGGATAACPTVLATHCFSCRAACTFRRCDV